MSHLDDLKDAMASPPDFTAQPLDLDRIMAAGGRVRRRRRLAVSAASGVAVAALLVGGGYLAQSSAAPAPGLPAAGNGPVSQQPAATADPTPTAPTSPASESPAPTSTVPPAVWGNVAKTGIDDWLVYATRIDDARLPGIHFGVNLGKAAGNGQSGSQAPPVCSVLTNETSGSDRSAGFHAVEGSMVVDAGRTLTFGYYVGPATKITAVVGGHSVTAAHKAWTIDKTVQFFWFAPAGTVSKLTAFGKNGERLKSGNNQPGVG
jgi:hypothetical protein